MPLTEQRKRYRRENREKVLACSKRSWPAYYARNKAKYQERARRFRKTHPAEYRQAMRDSWKKRDVQHVLAEKRKWREKNRDAIRAYAKEWRNKNRLRYRVLQRKYEALKVKAAVNLKGILTWMERMRSKRVVTCYYCQKLVPTLDIHFDHIVPLSKGGPHSIENLCVTCAFCNLSKGAKPVRAWIRMGQQLLEL